MSYRDELQKRPIPPNIHGKAGTYQNWGCRCRPCTDASSRASAAWRERNREKIRAQANARNRQKGMAPAGSEAHINKLRKDEPQYAAMHARARKILPPMCEFCGSEADLECALKGDTPAERIRTVPADAPVYAGSRYSIAETDYIRLCYSCHTNYDDRQRGIHPA